MKNKNLPFPKNIMQFKIYFLRKRIYQKIRFLLILTTVIFVSCNTSKNTTKYLHLNNLNRDITFQNANLGKIKTAIYGDNSLISLLDNRNGILYIYNYNQNLFTDSIDIKYRTKQFLFDYQILDTNRVLLSVNPTYFADQHDSVVCIIDRNKTVLKTFSFHNTPAPIYNENLPYAYRKTNWWYSIHSNFPIRLNEKDSTVLAVLAPFNNLTCDSIVNKSMKFAYRISLKNNTPATPLNYTIPECSEYYDKSSNITKTPYGDYGKDNKPVFGYTHSSRLITENTIFEPHLQLYDVIDENTFLNYKKLIYDKYRNCFWWVIEVDYNDGNSEKKLKNYYDYYLVSLDEKMEVISEGFMPQYSNLYIVPVEEGLFIKNEKKSDSLGVAYYSLFTPALQNWNMKKAKSELSVRTKKNYQDLEKFFEFLKNESSENKILLLSLDQMPPNYATILLDRLFENKENFNNCTIHIFTNDGNKIPEKLKTIIKVHRYSVLKEYINDFSAPVILEKSENNEIKLTEYPTNKAQILFEKISNW